MVAESPLCMCESYVCPIRDFFFKVIIAGNAGVGKSALMQRFLFDEYNEGRVTLPVGVKCRVR